MPSRFDFLWLNARAHQRQHKEPHQVVAENMQAVRWLWRSNGRFVDRHPLTKDRFSTGRRALFMREKEMEMPANKSGPLDDIALLDIAIEIQRIVEEREGVQENAGRQIEYAFHAALIMVDGATRHLSDTQRVESLRTAVAMFTEIAETDYIKRIDQRLN